VYMTTAGRGHIHPQALRKEAGLSPKRITVYSTFLI
jgi:hypothetical protein